MYIEIHNHEDFSQKVLYFKLNNAFNMDINHETNIKIAGLYAIFKDNICLYVGQSKNLASRIATHIKGKYENFTDLYVWNIEEIGFGDFLNRDIKSRDLVLNNCEKWLISKLKPIENIIADMNFKLDENKSPDIDLEDSSCITILNTNYSIIVTDSYSRTIEDVIMECDMLNSCEKLTKKEHKTIRDVLKQYDDISFAYKGYKNEH